MIIVAFGCLFVAWIACVLLALWVALRRIDVVGTISGKKQLFCMVMTMIMIMVLMMITTQYCVGPGHIGLVANVQSASILFTLLACCSTLNKFLMRMGIMMVNAKGDAFPSGDQILVWRQCFVKVFTRYPAWPYSNDTPSRSLWIRSIDKKMYAASEKSAYES